MDFAANKTYTGSFDTYGGIGKNNGSPGTSFFYHTGLDMKQISITIVHLRHLLHILILEIYCVNGNPKISLHISPQSVCETKFCATIDQSLFYIDLTLHYIQNFENLTLTSLN